MAACGSEHYKRTTPAGLNMQWPSSVGEIPLLRRNWRSSAGCGTVLTKGSLRAADPIRCTRMCDIGTCLAALLPASNPETTMRQPLWRARSHPFPLRLASLRRTTAATAGVRANVARMRRGWHSLVPT
jgi:hypothetical protein